MEGGGECMQDVLTKIHTHFNVVKRRREKTNQHKHFPRVDLCDSITLNILSPEQAQLPSNHC